MSYYRNNTSTGNNIPSSSFSNKNNNNNSQQYSSRGQHSNIRSIHPTNQYYSHQHEQQREVEQSNTNNNNMNQNMPQQFVGLYSGDADKTPRFQQQQQQQQSDLYHSSYSQQQNQNGHGFYSLSLSSQQQQGNQNKENFNQGNHIASHHQSNGQYNNQPSPSSKTTNNTLSSTSSSVGVPNENHESLITTTKLLKSQVENLTKQIDSKDEQIFDLQATLGAVEVEKKTELALGEKRHQEQLRIYEEDLKRSGIENNKLKASLAEAKRRSAVAASANVNANAGLAPSPSSSAAAAAQKKVKNNNHNDNNDTNNTKKTPTKNSKRSFITPTTSRKRRLDQEDQNNSINNQKQKKISHSSSTKISSTRGEERRKKRSFQKPHQPTHHRGRHLLLLERQSLGGKLNFINDIRNLFLYRHHHHSYHSSHQDILYRREGGMDDISSSYFLEKLWDMPGNPNYHRHQHLHLLPPSSITCCEKKETKIILETLFQSILDKQMCFTRLGTTSMIDSSSSSTPHNKSALENNNKEHQQQQQLQQIINYYMDIEYLLYFIHEIFLENHHSRHLLMNYIVSKNVHKRINTPPKKKESKNTIFTTSTVSPFLSSSTSRIRYKNQSSSSISSEKRKLLFSPPSASLKNQQQQQEKQDLQENSTTSSTTTIDFFILIDKFISLLINDFCVLSGRAGGVGHDAVSVAFLSMFSNHHNDIQQQQNEEHSTMECDDTLVKMKTLPLYHSEKRIQIYALSILLKFLECFGIEQQEQEQQHTTMTNKSDVFLSTSASFVKDLFQRKIVSGDNTNHSIELELELIHIIEAEPPISLFLSMQQQHEGEEEEEKLLAHNNTVNNIKNFSSFSSKQQKHDYMEMSNLLMSIKRNAMKLLTIYYSLSQKDYHHHQDNSSSSLTFHLKPRVVKTCLQFLEMWNGFILAESRTTTTTGSSFITTKDNDDNEDDQKNFPKILSLLFDEGNFLYLREIMDFLNVLCQDWDGGVDLLFTFCFHPQQAQVQESFIPFKSNNNGGVGVMKAKQQLKRKRGNISSSSTIDSKNSAWNTTSKNSTMTTGIITLIDTLSILSDELFHKDDGVLLSAEDWILQEVFDIVLKIIQVFHTILIHCRTKRKILVEKVSTTEEEEEKGGVLAAASNGNDNVESKSDSGDKIECNNSTTSNSNSNTIDEYVSFLSIVLDRKDMLCISLDRMLLLDSTRNGSYEGVPCVSFSLSEKIKSQIKLILDEIHLDLEDKEENNLVCINNN